MRWFQRVRNWMGRMVAFRTSSAPELGDELQALFDLSCYAASQAVTYLKLIEWQLDKLAARDDHRERLIQEHSNLQRNLEDLRGMINMLQALLNSGRANLVLGPSRREWESSRGMIAELLTSRDVLDLKDALRNLDQKSVGSEP